MHNNLEYAHLGARVFSTNYQKILMYLVCHPSAELTEGEIQEAVSISRASANLSLRALTKDGLVQSLKKGKTAFYSISLKNPIIRQFKVLINLLDIHPLVSSLQDSSEKIILFGSNSTGTNIEESDIDLFVLANQPNKVREIINHSPLAEKLQPVIQKPIDYLTLRKKDTIFYDEISRGLLLWEKS